MTMAFVFGIFLGLCLGGLTWSCQFRRSHTWSPDGSICVRCGRLNDHAFRRAPQEGTK